MFQTVLYTDKRRRYGAEAADSLGRNFAFAEHDFVSFGVKPDKLLPTIPAPHKSGIETPPDSAKHSSLERGAMVIHCG